MMSNTVVIKVVTGLLLVFSSYTWASSTGSDSNPSSLSGTYTVYSAPTSQIIVEKTPYGGTVCALTGTTSTSAGFKTASAKWRSANIAGTISNGGYTYEIQRTNIPGIGVISRMEATFVENQLNNAVKVIGSTYQTITATVNAGAAKVFFGRKYWALVTIPGESVTPGSYSLGQTQTMVDVWCQANNASNDAHGGGYLSGTVVIKAPTCSLGSDVSSVMTMDLGKHQWVDVRNLGVGSNFGSVSKSLSMQCQAGAWPKLLISDKNNNNNNSTIISLTNPSATSTAKGVGVQLFINNQATPQQLATTINLVPSQLTKDTSIELPLQFKYVKTSNTLSTGEANAIVDLTFTYD